MGVTSVDPSSVASTLHLATDLTLCRDIRKIDMENMVKTNKQTNKQTNKNKQKQTKTNKNKQKQTTNI